MRSATGPISTTLRCALPLAFVLAACSKGDKVPAYLDIPAITLNAGSSAGGNTIRATDAWVYADEELIGVWELPARVPVLKTGQTMITVAAGIKQNGMYDDRLRYPFYTRWDGMVDLAPTASHTIQPVVSYIPQAYFWIEAFEDVGTQLNVTENSDTTLLRFTPQANPDIVLDGTPCGGVILDSERRFIRLYTDVDFEPTGGPIFLELDYRNDVQFTVGLTSVQGGTPVAQPYVYVVPTRRSDGTMPWNKIYIELSSRWNLAGITQRNFYLEVSLPSDRNSGQVYFDNIKVVRATS